MTNIDEYNEKIVYYSTRRRRRNENVKIITIIIITISIKNENRWGFDILTFFIHRYQ